MLLAILNRTITSTLGSKIAYKCKQQIRVMSHYPNLQKSEKEWLDLPLDEDL